MYLLKKAIIQMKHYILALVLAMASINAAIAANPIREGNMISGHVLVKGSEENIPYATVLIVGEYLNNHIFN